MLTVEGLDVFHGDAQALDGVSLEVAEGAIVAIVGANGAGKSSLIRTIADSYSDATIPTKFRMNVFSTGASTAAITRRTQFTESWKQFTECGSPASGVWGIMVADRDRLCHRYRTGRNHTRSHTLNKK